MRLKCWRLQQIHDVSKKTNRVLCVPRMNIFRTEDEVLLYTAHAYGCLHLCIPSFSVLYISMFHWISTVSYSTLYEIYLGRLDINSSQTETQIVCEPDWVNVQLTVAPSFIDTLASSCFFLMWDHGFTIYLGHNVFEYLINNHR